MNYKFNPTEKLMSLTEIGAVTLTSGDAGSNSAKSATHKITAETFGFDPTRLYATNETAEIAGLTIACFEAWRSRGENAGPRFLRLGRRAIRYAGSDLIAWLAASRSPTSGGE